MRTRRALVPALIAVLATLAPTTGARSPGTSEAELNRHVLRAHERFRKDRIDSARSRLADAFRTAAPGVDATATYVRAAQSLAFLHVLSGDPEAAVPVLRRAIELEVGGTVPRDPFRLATSRVNLAAIHSCAGRWDEALPLLEEARKDAVDPLLVAWLRARALHDLGRIEKAGPAYRALVADLESVGPGEATYRTAAAFDVIAFETDHGNPARTNALAPLAVPTAPDVPTGRVRCWSLPVLVADAPLVYRRPGSVDAPGRGEARVRGTIDVDGRVRDVVVVDEDRLSPEDRRDARAAAGAFRTWRFFPSLADGRRVPFRSHPIQRRPAGVADSEPR